MKVLLPISLDRWRNPISSLLRACVRYNPEIEFHSFSNPLSDEDRAEGHAFWKLPNLVRSSRAEMIRSRFDIVHVASFSRLNHLAAVGSKLRGMGDTRFLNTMNLEPDPANPLAWSRYRKVLRWADAFVAVSEAVAADFRQRVPARFLGVIPNGLEADLYRKEAANEDALPGEVRGLEPGFPLWMAALEKRKHPEVLVALAKRNPHLTFVAVGPVIPGDGEDAEKAFESTPNILWLGSVGRAVARAILCKAGVTIFPSEREGLSLAMIEAVGMGVPIIAQPKSSMPELVTPGSNGELLDIADLDGWNDAMLRWSSNRTDEMKTGLIAARQSALTRFDWSTVGAAYGPVYRQVVERPSQTFYRIPS